jgi:hypothetical protein
MYNRDVEAFLCVVVLIIDEDKDFGGASSSSLGKPQPDVLITILQNQSSNHY